MLRLLLWINSRFTPAHVSMMERITGHLCHKARVIAILIRHNCIVIENVLKNFTLNGLRIMVFMNFLISCFLNSHVFKLLNDFEARGFMLVGILMSLKDRWMADDVFDGYKLRFAYSSLAGQIWINHKLAERIILWNRFRVLNWLVLFSLFDFNKVTLLVVLFVMERWVFLLSFRALFKIIL